MPRDPQPIPSLEAALAGAIEAHATFEPNERLSHVTLGRYNADRVTTAFANDGRSYYWRVTAERVRTLQGPAEARSGPSDLAAQRHRELLEIVDAYNEARDRLAEPEAVAADA